jgi:hypothetical protein
VVRGPPGTQPQKICAICVICGLKGRMRVPLAKRFSVNLDGHSHRDLINYAGCIPVCQADAAVAG